jgi:hypothetical protein
MNQSRFPGRNIHLMFCCFCAIIDSLVCIFTLGFKQSGIEMRYLVWNACQAAKNKGY